MGTDAYIHCFGHPVNIDISRSWGIMGDHAGGGRGLEASSETTLKQDVGIIAIVCIKESIFHVTNVKCVRSMASIAPPIPI